MKIQLGTLRENRQMLVILSGGMLPLLLVNYFGLSFGWLLGVGFAGFWIADELNSYLDCRTMDTDVIRGDEAHQ